MAAEDVKIRRRLICTAGFTLTWLICLELAQAKEECVKCSATQITDEYHSYKVDGRKCWVKGKPGKYSVDELYWEQKVPNLIWQEEYRWRDPTGWTHQE